MGDASTGFVREKLLFSESYRQWLLQCFGHEQKTDSKYSAVERRCECQKCGRRRSLYCYDCLVPTNRLRNIMPSDGTPLPLKIHLVLHPQEKRSKATSLQCPILCRPEDVTLQVYPRLPPCVYDDPDRTLLVYPTPTARSLNAISDLGRFKHAVFIDSTWKQSGSILREATVLHELPHQVYLQQYNTKFWRFQDKGETFLATIEAIYYFLREYHTIRMLPQWSSAPENHYYDSRYDDLLVLFVHQYCKIQFHYRMPGVKRTFTRRHRLGDSYIQMSNDIFDSEEDFNRKSFKPSVGMKIRIGFLCKKLKTFYKYCFTCYTLRIKQ